jgi:hypothetical protein
MAMSGKAESQVTEIRVSGSLLKLHGLSPQANYTEGVYYTRTKPVNNPY